jgi:hypothetical protein
MKGTLREEADLDLHNRVGGEAKCNAMQLKRTTGLEPSDSDRQPKMRVAPLIPFGRKRNDRIPRRFQRTHAP